MPFSRPCFFLVLFQVRQCLGSTNEEKIAVSSGERMYDSCPSLLQVDLTRTSQVQTVNVDVAPKMSVAVAPKTELLARGINEKPGAQKPGTQPASDTQPKTLPTSQDNHGILPHTSDLPKHTAARVTDSIPSNQVGQAPALNQNSTVIGRVQTQTQSQTQMQAHAEFLQKPYLELYIYFDVLFVTVALLIFFLLPQALGAGKSEEVAGARADLPPFLPALSSLRYFAMATVWMKHHWFHQLFNTSEFVLILSGFVLEYAEQRIKSDELVQGSLQSKYERFLPRRFARLYPLYALHVIFGHLSSPGPDTCDPFRALMLYQSWGYGTGTFEGGKLVYHSCGIGTWFVSVIFGCYFLFPIMSRPMRHLPGGSAGVLWACCSMFAILPRALASPAGARNVWWNDVFHQQTSSVGLVELLVSQKSLLHGLAHFFMGMVLARCWVASSLLSMSGPDVKRGFVHRISTSGCTLGMLALGAQWWLCLKHPNIMSNGYGMRLLSEVWKVTFQSVVLLGAAGPCNSASCLADPIRWVLSLPWMAWLGELALPLYLTTTWACDFSDKLMLHIGISQKSPSSQVSYFVSQLFVTHIIALTIYRSCGALTTRVANLVVKEEQVVKEAIVN